MPFGLCNALDHIPEVDARVLFGISEFCDLYIDDILVFSGLAEEHIESPLSSVQVNEGIRLKLHQHKCNLGHSKAFYLSHVVSQDGISRWCEE